MAPRAYWKGYLKLSLVSCPVALSPATSSSERISFRQINKKTGNRLRQQLVDEVTREPVDAADKGKGYEVDKGVYIEVEDDELEAIEVESKHTIEIDRFVPAAAAARVVERIPQPVGRDPAHGNLDAPRAQLRDRAGLSGGDGCGDGGSSERRGDGRGVRRRLRGRGGREAEDRDRERRGRVERKPR